MKLSSEEQDKNNSYTHHLSVVSIQYHTTTDDHAELMLRAKQAVLGKASLAGIGFNTRIRVRTTSIIQTQETL